MAKNVPKIMIIIQLFKERPAYIAFFKNFIQKPTKLYYGTIGF